MPPCVAGKKEEDIVIGKADRLEDCSFFIDRRFLFWQRTYGGGPVVKQIGQRAIHFNFEFGDDFYKKSLFTKIVRSKTDSS